MTNSTSRLNVDENAVRRGICGIVNHHTFTHDFLKVFSRRHVARPLQNKPTEIGLAIDAEKQEIVKSSVVR